MNGDIIARQRRGIAIALKQFPWLKEYDKKSGIYLWSRWNKDEEYCWYIGKAKNILRRTAQHIIDGQSHLDKSIKKYGFAEYENIDNLECSIGKPTTWSVTVLEVCGIEDLDKLEQYYIDKWKKDHPKGKMYNVESGGTTGKTIIGEKKQRRDIKWKAEARAKVIAEYREYFDIVPKDNAYKKNTYLNELKAEPKRLKTEYYG